MTVNYSFLKYQISQHMIVRTDNWHGPDYMEVDLEPKPYKNFITRCDECKKANGYKICVELNNSNKPNLLDRIKCQELFPNTYPKIKFS